MEAAQHQLTVQIRSPSLHETLTIDTHQDATIRELKQIIHGIHPKRPAVNDQRIIFGGKVLGDGDVLKQILERTDFINTPPTLHLVVKPSLPNSGMGTSSSASFGRSSTTAAPPSSSFAAEPQSPFQPQTQTNGSGTAVPPQPLPAYPSMLPGGYQVVALNGQYYLAPVLVPNYDPSLLQQQQQQQQHQHAHSTQGMAGAAGAAPGAPAMRPRENNIQRATSVWLALKLIFVLFILCQDASLERILFFHAIAFIFFLYQTGRLPVVFRQVRVEDLDLNGAPRQQQQAPAPPAPQVDTRTQAPPSPNAQQGYSTGVDVNNDNSNPTVRSRQQGEGQQEQQEQQEQQQQQQPTPVQTRTFMGTLKRGAYTFIASLWPNYGNDARVAQALDNGQQDAWEGF